VQRCGRPRKNEAAAVRSPAPFPRTTDPQEVELIRNLTLGLAALALALTGAAPLRSSA
jgi:hypothetical protein